MGKRSNFKRMKGDFYVTPPEAVLPLLPHLHAKTHFAEPCAGDGALVDALEGYSHKCVYAADINPQREDIVEQDIFNWTRRIDADADADADAELYITNPPWTRKLLHQIIINLSAQKPTWLLFDSDWAHTKQAIPYKYHCRKIVSVGRVSWMGNGVNGKDNASWYLFDQTQQQIPRHEGTEFVWRAA